MEFARLLLSARLRGTPSALNISYVSALALFKGLAGCRYHYETGLERHAAPP